MKDRAHDASGEVLTERRIGTRTPRPYNVVLYNDDYTTMEFVVKILKSVFHHTTTAANRIMLKVHNQGKAIAGTYTKDIAETKVMETISEAKKHGHPLKCSVEPA